MTSTLLIGAAGLLVIGTLMFVVAMFRTSIWWGIGGLVFLPVQIVFIFKHWQESKQALAVQSVGFVLLLVAAFTGGEAFIAQYQQEMGNYMQQAAPAQWEQLQEMQALLGVPDDSINQLSHSVKNSVSHVANGTAVNAVNSAVKNTVGQLAETAPAADGNKVVYKCVDASKRVSYREQPCEGAPGKVFKLKDNYSAEQENQAVKMFESAKKMVTKDPEAAPSGYRCDGRTHCSQMTSCEEAKYFLANCPSVEMDGNHDGVPCEQQWCGR